MKLKLERTKKASGYTEGRLYLNGKYFCDTIEDRVRPTGEKVYGQTAIPEGSYQLVVNESARFKKQMPLLLDVPNFKGIRIHSGNTASDSEGCILVGVKAGDGVVGQSRITFTALMEELGKHKSETHSIEIV
jgi:hypothetical protein